MNHKVAFRIGSKSINLTRLTNEERYKLRHGIALPIKVRKTIRNQFVFCLFKEWNNDKRFYKEA